MAASKKTRSKKSAAKKTAAKKTAAKKTAAKKTAAKKTAAKKTAAPKRIAKKTAPAAPPEAAAKRPAVHLRDATGHLDPQYEADLLARSGQSVGDEHAFLGRPRSGDDLAEQLGEGFVEAVTTGESDAELEREEKEEDEDRLA
jgi:RNA polymerase primary sigma factor